MRKYKVDVMVNDGDTFYGSAVVYVNPTWKMVDGKVEEVVEYEDLKEAVLGKFPTLRGKDYAVFTN